MQNTFGIYCRTSTTAQADNTSIPEQKRIGTEFIISLGATPALYVNESVSGASPSREHYQRLLTDLRQGKLQGVWVIAVDRIGRDVEEATRFIKLLKAYYVSLRYLTRRGEKVVNGNYPLFPLSRIHVRR